jgi:hypothetical protein
VVDEGGFDVQMRRKLMEKRVKAPVAAAKAPKPDAEDSAEEKYGHLSEREPRIDSRIGCAEHTQRPSING